jgi:hypothetical protein
LDVVAMDLMGPYVTSKRGHRFILTIVDVFTGWVELTTLRDKRSDRIARAFMEQFICRYGMPKRLVTDNGSEFANSLATYIAKSANIEHVRISAYHAQSNFAERVNKEVKKALRLRFRGHPKDWDEQLQEAAFTMRTTPNEGTGLTPAQLMLGFNPRFPQDVEFQRLLAADVPREITGLEQRQYAQWVRRQLRRMYRDQAKFKSIARARQEKYYNLRRRDHPFKIGDRVWTRQHEHSKKGECTASLLPVMKIQTYKLTDQMTPVTFCAQNEEDGSIVVRHVSDLRPYTPPFQVAPSAPGLSGGDVTA